MALFRAGQENKRARETALVFAGKNPERLQRCCRLCSWPAAAKARAQRAVALSVQNSGQETFTQQEQADKNAKSRDEKETQSSGLA